MKGVVLHELKHRLGYHIRLVRAGHQFQVIDRGEVVAELLPPRHPVIGGHSCRGLEELPTLKALGLSVAPVE